MQASLLMTRDVVTCRPDATLAEAARLMRDNEIGFLPIVSEGRRIEAVLTDRDAFMASAAADKPLSQLAVRSAMKRPVTSCPPEMDIDLVERLMAEKRLHRLPVADEEGRLLGVISIDDLARVSVRKGDRVLQQRVALTLGAVAQRSLADEDVD